MRVKQSARLVLVKDRGIGTRPHEALRLRWLRVSEEENERAFLRAVGTAEKVRFRCRPRRRLPRPCSCVTVCRTKPKVSLCVPTARCRRNRTRSRRPAMPVRPATLHLLCRDFVATISRLRNLMCTKTTTSCSPLSPPLQLPRSNLVQAP